MRLGWLLVLASCGGSASLSTATVGDDGGQLAISDGGRTLTWQRGGRTLLAFPTDAFQLGVVDALSNSASYDPAWPDPPGLRWLVPTGAELSGGGDGATVKLRFDGATATLELAREAAGRLRARLVPDGATVAYLRLRPRAPDGEGFYGLGEWEDSVEHRGKLRPMQLELAPDSESVDNEAHVPIPLLIGTSGWGLFVESRRVGLFDVATQDPNLVQITFGTADDSPNGLVFHLLAAEQPLDVTKHYYDLTGYPRVPAEWALGPWIWRDENKDQQQVLDDIAMLQSLDLATSGIWIDRPYATAVNTFDFDATKFPDPRGLVAATHNAGLRLAVWSTPYLEMAAQPYRGQADASGWFPPVHSVLTNSWSPPIDLTNHDAYAFWQGLVRKYTDLGIEGFKLDYAEDVVPAFMVNRSPWKFSDGSDERTMHWGYTTLYHQVYAETLPSTGYFLLCRAGRWGDQTHVSVIWPGDMDASFEKHDPHGNVGGLPATVIMGVGLGPSGFPFFGADTGGYRHSPPDKELFIRWFEQTALSTVMDVGDSSSQTPWEFTADNGRDQETLDLYRTYARLHMRLHPYEWTHAQRIAMDGRPIVRPFGLQFPELGVHPDDEYLFGDDLLVAPVVDRGLVARDVIFPPGVWIDWWDGTAYEGKATVPAPLGKLPLFLRAGGIVPLLRPTIDAIAPATTPGVDSYGNDPGRLYVRIAHGPPSSFTLWDGARIDVAGDGIHVADGTVFKQGMTLELIAADPPGAVKIDGSPVAWTYGPDAGGTLSIAAPPGAHTITIAPGTRGR